MNLITHGVRTAVKSFCISVHGVKMWNRLNVEREEGANMTQLLKKKCNEMILITYWDEDGC